MDAAKGIVGPWTARQCRPLGATMERRNPAKPGRIEGQAFLATFVATDKSSSPGRAKPSPVRQLGRQPGAKAIGEKNQLEPSAAPLSPQPAPAPEPLPTLPPAARSCAPPAPSARPHGRSAGYWHRFHRPDW